MKFHAKILCSDAATQFSNCTDNAIRLVEGNSSNQGRLEVCVNNAWGSVCDSTGVFTSDEAKVVCRQLGILQVEGKDPIPLQVEGRDNPQSQFQLTAELNIEREKLFSSLFHHFSLLYHHYSICTYRWSRGCGSISLWR